MALTLSWRRILRIAAFSACVLLLVTVALVRMQQCLLRWRAERLLSDIRSLQLGKSTWADAQKIMTRWKKWGSYNGSCSEEQCRFLSDLRGPQCSPFLYGLMRALPLLATRDSGIEADLEVIHGIVWAKDFAVYLVVAGGISSDDYGYVLLASARTVWRTAEFNRYTAANHPDYVVGHPGGCEGCKAVYARFTPFVAPSEARDLMDFNFDCLTRLFQCKDQIDIMPYVWRQVQAEEEQQASTRKARSGPFYPSTPGPEFLGRDRVNVVIAEVISTRMEQEPDGAVTYATFRLEQRLKHATFWAPERLLEENSSPDLTSVSKSDEGKLLAPGRKVILAFDTPYELPHQGLTDIGDYQAIPLTDSNLATIRKGMQADIFPASTYRNP